MMNSALIDRLVCSRYLFLRGQEILARPAPFYSGLAVLSFHDAVELCLRVIAEHIGARVHENIQFHSLIEEIDKVGTDHIPNRTELNQLNRMRNGFKHAGLAPDPDDAQKIRRALSDFFDTTLDRFAKVRFDTLSLAQLVRKLRVRNRLIQAEASVESGDFNSALTRSAEAFQLFLSRHANRSYRSSIAQDVRSQLSRNTRANPIGHGVMLLAEKTDDQIKKVWEQIDLLSAGLDFSEYRRFVSLTPHVMISAAGTLWVSEQHASGSGKYDDARFCVEFALRNILRMQDQFGRPSRIANDAPECFRVIKRSPIVIYPFEGKETETLADPELGTLLRSYAKRAKNGFTEISFDGELAYIASDAIEETEP